MRPPLDEHPYRWDSCPRRKETGGRQNQGICFGTYGSNEAVVKYMWRSGDADDLTLNEFDRMQQVTKACSGSGRSPDCRNVVSMMGAVREDGNDRTVGFVMPYLNGNNLMVGRRNPEVRRRIGTYIAQSFAGIQVLHRQDLIHIDIKPENIVLHSDSTGETYAVVIDLSMTVPVGANLLGGTSWYQLKKMGKATTDQDRFALIMTAYMILDDAMVTQVFKNPTLPREHWAAFIDTKIRANFPDEVRDIEARLAALDPLMRLSLASFNPTWPTL